MTSHQENMLIGGTMFFAFAPMIWFIVMDIIDDIKGED